jgi:hypothetical protein
VLWREGVWTEVWPLHEADSLITKLDQSFQASATNNEPPLSHVVVSAPWIPTANIAEILVKYPGLEFAVICHSDVGFLQTEAAAIALMKEYVLLHKTYRNMTVAGNNRRFVTWAKSALSPAFKYLPDLYDTATFKPPVKPPWSGKHLKVGCFGAPRILKNVITAAAATLDLASSHRIKTEFHVTCGREDENGYVYAPIKEMLSGHWTDLVFNEWMPWPQFRELVHAMDITINPSFTESFCICAADSIAEAVASACAETIDWVPRSWKSRSDDSHDFAVTMMSLLTNTFAPMEGQTYLEKHVQEGVSIWMNYLIGNPQVSIGTE